MGHMWSLKQLGEIITIDMDNIFKSLKIFLVEFIKTVWLSDWTRSHNVPATVMVSHCYVSSLMVVQTFYPCFNNLNYQDRVDINYELH